jgi:predicted nuclease of predicted toxin-antitoxin system
MKFLLDHDVFSYVLCALTIAKHEVIQLADVLPSTSTDRLVFKMAFELNCVMVTCNRHDFLSLAKVLPFHGLIIVVRRVPPALEGQHLLRETLQVRFGQVPQPVQLRIAAESSVDQLKLWHRLALTSSSLEAFKGALRDAQLNVTGGVVKSKDWPLHNRSISGLRASVPLW